MRMIEAEVIDANHLKLLYPIHIPPDSKIMISILPNINIDDEYENWVEFSIEQVANFYSKDEPEYSDNLIKKINPEFIQ
ncbi:MAG: hypothetical protein HQK63_07785 [Desulfamplus sp.]|nr:hypothetical protein [Desulfamplus sp.]